jgi:hypothetical protein
LLLLEAPAGMIDGDVAFVGVLLLILMIDECHGCTRRNDGDDDDDNNTDHLDMDDGGTMNDNDNDNDDDDDSNCNNNCIQNVTSSNTIQRHNIQ